MDAKRELTSVDLAALTRELSAFTGARFEKGYLYPDDMVRFRLRHPDRGRVELLVDVRDPKHLRVAAPEHVADAPERPPDFAMMLRNRLEGAELVGVSQYEFDRIVELHFARTDDSTTVVAELFGDGNLAVLDTTGDVIDSLETVRLQSRTVAPGSRYEFPEARFNPLTVDEDGFRARMRDSDADVVRTLATQLNFGGFWAEELCTRTSVEETRPIAEVSDAELETLYAAVAQLSATLTSGTLGPRVYVDPTDEGHGRPVDVTPVDVVAYPDMEARTFDTFNDAVDHYVESLATTSEPERRPDFDEQIERQERIIGQQAEAIADFDAAAAAEREKAELLYANYDLVDEVLSTIRAARADEVPWADIESRLEEGAAQDIAAAAAVTEVDGSAGTVTIDLEEHAVTVDVDVGVEKNADRLYEEAKRIEDKRDGAQAAIEESRQEMADLEAQRDAWAPGEEPAEPTEDTAAEPDWLSTESIPVRQSTAWYERFRWFQTTDDFLVIGGRNADDNEDLVKKYLEPGDRFLHAQAHGGPATVLKATGPSETTKDVEIPDTSLEQAAQFAVSYSSVWEDGVFTGDVYAVGHDQVSKTPESGEYLEKGGFAIRGERTYFEDVAVGVAVGITCEPETRVIGGPPAAIESRAVTSVRLEPGRFAIDDVAQRIYRELRSRFTDDAFVRKVASPDQIAAFLPPGGSRIVDG